MLSYQHIYHAGNKADLHKHAMLARVLESLEHPTRPTLYIETHAGRGLYNLRAPENIKTREAAEGWLKAIKDKRALAALPASYLDAVRALNKGALEPYYPGSPKIAAHILQRKDRLFLYDLHPAEFAALEKNMKHDARVKMQQRDGLEGALTGAKMHDNNYGQGLIFIDPSYEIKSEYEAMPEFIEKISALMPKMSILLWVPMLPSLRHETTLGMMDKIGGVQVSESVWSRPEDGRGMFGSLLFGLNMPENLDFK